MDPSVSCVCVCVCVCGLWQQISSVFSCKKINNTLLNQITVPGAGIAANQDLICGHTFTESILSQDTDRGADVFTGQSVCYSQYKCTHTQAQTHTHTQQRLPNIFVGAGYHSNRAELVLRNPVAAVNRPSERGMEWETQTESRVRDLRRWKVEWYLKNEFHSMKTLSFI